MNMSLKLDFDAKTLLPVLRKIQPYFFGLALIGVFAYTAWIVNAALNVKPAEAALTTAVPGTTIPKIVFDKTTIESIKKLEVVSGTVPVGSLGKDDPFK